MIRYDKSILLVSMASLVVTLAGCETAAPATTPSTDRATRPAPVYANDPVRRAPLPTAAPRAPSLNGPTAPAQRSAIPRAQRKTPAASPSGPFGLPSLQPSDSARDTSRTNLAPQVIPELPDTPEAANQARVKRPEGTEPAPPSGSAAIFGLGSGAGAGGGSGTPQVPTYSLSIRDRARAFYAVYLRDFHVEWSDNNSDLYDEGVAQRARRTLREQLRKGKETHPEGYQAFSDLFEPRWWYETERFPQGLEWVLSDHSLPLHDLLEDPTMERDETDDSHKMSAFLSILSELFPGMPEVETAELDLDPQTARLVDPMSAQDFYNQYLRSAHQAYLDAWWHKKDNRANDFAEALATGVRSEPVGYEALREQVEEAAGQDVLAWFRHDWNNFLRLRRGTGNDADIDYSGDEPEVGGKTKSEWYDQALANMKKVSSALSQTR